MTSGNNQSGLYTPWAELRRYGYRRAFASRWTLSAFIVALIATLLVPWGQSASLSVLAALHATMLGFGITVFGFTILGGKDDFFEPLLKSLGERGLTALRDMVLLLFWPLLLHFVATALCVIRMAGTQFCSSSVCCAIIWRLAYAFVATWAVLQSYLSMRYLFTLAITRLVWKYRETRGRPDGGGDPPPT